MAKLNCKQASELLSQSMDRRLTWAERWRLRWHLFACEACTRFKRQMEFLRAAMQHSKGKLFTLSPAARERMRNAMRQD
jgi:hypothetical protein